MIKFVLLYVVLMNLLGFFMMGFDKYKAKKGTWRIPEKRLFLVAVLGGSIGTFAGMWVFRHKTRHWYFVIGMSLILILHLGMTGSVIYYCNDYYRAEKWVKDDLKTGKTVSVEKMEDGTYVFTPKRKKAKDAFVFYPGGKVQYTAYAPLMEAVAGRGIKCYLVKMPVNLAVLDSDKADDLKEELQEYRHIYIGGHSLGGAMAASYVKDHKKEYDGLILLGAYSTKNLRRSGLHVVSIYGSEDGVLDREKYEKYHKNLPKDLVEVVIEGGCHSYFGAYGNQEGDGTPEITGKEQILQTADIIAKQIKE